MNIRIWLEQELSQLQINIFNGVSFIMIKGQYFLITVCSFHLLMLLIMLPIMSLML